VVELLIKQGRIDGAITVLRPRADAGEWQAADMLARLLLEHDRLKELTDRANGDYQAASLLARQLLTQGRVDEAIALWRPLSAAGNESAGLRIAGLLADQGRTDEAIAILREQVDTGSELAAFSLVRLLTTQNRREDLAAEVAAGTEGASAPDTPQGEPIWAAVLAKWLSADQDRFDESFPERHPQTNVAPQ
jgi:hypothetical protein